MNMIHWLKANDFIHKTSKSMKISDQITQCQSLTEKKQKKLTCEYIKLNGKLIAIDNIQTNIILTVTRLRVLFRPKRIGYRNDK